MDVLADTLVVVLVFATLAQAWSWLGSYGGIVSLGHAVFFGIGAYAVGVSNARGGSPWYGALGGGLAAVLVAAIAGGLLVRGRGALFTVLTLAAGIAAEPFAVSHRWLGPAGAYAFPVHPGFLNLQFSAKWPYMLLALAVFAVTQALTYALRATRPGYALRALRANAAAARASGISARPPRLLVLVASAFVTAVAGSFFAEYRLRVDPHAFLALSVSFDIALIGIVAGPRSAWGAPLAALLYVVVSRFVPLHPAGPAGAAVLLAQGIAIAAIALVRPDGIFSAPIRRSGVRVARSAA